MATLTIASGLWLWLVWFRGEDGQTPRWLLAKMALQVKAAEMGGKEVTQEVVFKDYREVEGAKIAMKFSVKRDGKQFVEAELKDYKAAGKLDDSVFAEPK